MGFYPAWCRSVVLRSAWSHFGRFRGSAPNAVAHFDAFWHVNDDGQFAVIAEQLGFSANAYEIPVLLLLDSRRQGVFLASKKAFRLPGSAIEHFQGNRRSANGRGIPPGGADGASGTFAEGHGQLWRWLEAATAQLKNPMALL